MSQKLNIALCSQVKRDQKVPTIWFIANIGGILGLSMGCSLVTIFEILHHAVIVAFRDDGVERGSSLMRWNEVA